MAERRWEEGEEGLSGGLGGDRAEHFKARAVFIKCEPGASARSSILRFRPSNSASSLGELGGRVGMCLVVGAVQVRLLGRCGCPEL